MIGGGKSPVRHAQARLRRLYGEDGGEAAARAWACGILTGAQLEAAGNPWRSLRALRRADGRLDLVTARYLVELVAGRGGADSSGSRVPFLE